MTAARDLPDDRVLVELGLDPKVGEACQNLGDWVTSVAEETSAEYGFRWRPSVMAPANLGDLRREVRACQISGLPLRVSSQHSDRTIYQTPLINMAFRFVHDTRHVHLDAEFDTDGELLVASCHLARLKHDGFDNGTIESRLMLADTVGQTVFAARTGGFPVDQRRFVLRCLTTDLNSAIDDEIVIQRFGEAA